MEQAEREQLARTMYGAGESVSALARATGLSPYLAGKLKPGAEKKAKKSASKKKPPEPEEEQDIPADYEVTLTVPTARLVDLFSAFTDVEKATAIQYILQCRMDEVVG